MPMVKAATGGKAPGFSHVQIRDGRTGRVKPRAVSNARAHITLGGKRAGANSAPTDDWVEVLVLG